MTEEGTRGDTSAWTTAAGGAPARISAGGLHPHQAGGCSWNTVLRRDGREVNSEGPQIAIDAYVFERDWHDDGTARKWAAGITVTRTVFDAAGYVTWADSGDATREASDLNRDYDSLAGAEDAASAEADLYAAENSFTWDGMPA